ncbi:MAG TPA: hypothetical protein VMG38_08935 [Trebonia sp.]|nr:hypothetical protein [Trebonia sp.]
MSDQSDPSAIGAQLIERLIQHAHDVQAELRDQSPARRARLHGGSEGWLITRYEDVKTMTTDPRLSRDLDGINRLAHGAADGDLL